MAFLPRYVLPGHPQHIIQRGNNRSAIFVREDDYRRYRERLIRAWTDLDVTSAYSGAMFSMAWFKLTYRLELSRFLMRHILVSMPAQVQ